MHTPLTTQDLKELKYTCRYGVVIPLLLFLIGFILILMFHIFEKLSLEFAAIALLVLFVVCVAIAFLMLRKLVQDIYQGEKIMECKKIRSKEYKADYEAGSGAIGGKMKPVDAWYLIIDNARYPVNKELFDGVGEGDEVYMHIAPRSGELLGITIV